MGLGLEVPTASHSEVLHGLRTAPQGSITQLNHSKGDLKFWSAHTAKSNRGLPISECPAGTRESLQPFQLLGNSCRCHPPRRRFIPARLGDGLVAFDP